MEKARQQKVRAETLRSFTLESSMAMAGGTVVGS